MTTASNWTLRDTSRTYERLLGLTELGFYWDSKFNGTADILRYAIIDAQRFIPSARLFSFENVTRTWVALKKQYPLLGAQLSERRQRTEVVFVVSEQRLSDCAPEEISFQSISSQPSLSSLGEVGTFMERMVNGERLLSDELLARLFVFTSTTQENRVCILLHVAHCITDGIATATLLRSFLDILSSEPSTIRWDLEERLALAVASERLIGDANSSTARQKWHYAMGRTLASIRMQKQTVHTFLKNTATRINLRSGGPYTSKKIYCTYAFYTRSFRICFLHIFEWRIETHYANLSQQRTNVRQCISCS